MSSYYLWEEKKNQKEEKKNIEKGYKINKSYKIFLFWESKRVTTQSLPWTNVFTVLFLRVLEQLAFSWRHLGGSSDMILVIYLHYTVACDDILIVESWFQPVLWIEMMDLDYPIISPPNNYHPASPFNSSPIPYIFSWHKPASSWA